MTKFFEQTKSKMSSSNDLMIGVTLLTIESIDAKVYNELTNLSFKCSYKVNGKVSILNYSIFIGNDIVMSKNGKFKFIDNRGSISYFIDDVNNLKSPGFNIENARTLHKGEEQLVKLFKALSAYNKNIESDFPVIDIAKIVKMDISEVQSFIDNFKDVPVVGLVGVKDGQYQDVFPEFYAGWQYPNGSTSKAVELRKTTIGKYAKLVGDYQGKSIFAPVELQLFDASFVIEKEEDDIPTINSENDLPF